VSTHEKQNSVTVMLSAPWWRNFESNDTQQGDRFALSTLFWSRQSSAAKQNIWWITFNSY